MDDLRTLLYAFYNHYGNDSVRVSTGRYVSAVRVAALVADEQTLVEAGFDPGRAWSPTVEDQLYGVDLLVASLRLLPPDCWWEVDRVDTLPAWAELLDRHGFPRLAAYARQVPGFPQPSKERQRAWDRDRRCKQQTQDEATIAFNEAVEATFGPVAIQRLNRETEKPAR